jgi:heavy metal translocating P-type ATPase
MEFKIVHELPGRIRVRSLNKIDRLEAVVIKALLETQDGVLSVSVSHRTGSILMKYEDGGCRTPVRDSLLAALKVLDRDFYADIDPSLLEEEESPSLTQTLFEFFSGVIFRMLLPGIISQAVAVYRALPVLKQGAASLMSHGLTKVSVLDAAAVSVSIARRDFKTVSVITSLLALGGILEEWTHKKSKEGLAESLALNIDKIWVRLEDGSELQIPFSELKVGDRITVRTGSVIPVDGVVASGEAMINMSSLTGESMPVHRSSGLTVYAGAIVEEGSLDIMVEAVEGKTRIDKIAAMIEESEKLKANVQSRAERMADKIVPYNFMLAGLIYLFTRDAVRASSALLVDYSCAIKLSTPIAFLSAMREGAKRGILIKGGKFLEAMSEADTVVFDKTGTLTTAAPTVAKVIPFEGYSRNEVLRTAACLEEHFPHSIARAVVRQAEEENLHHREEHSKVDYIMAHGIVSHLHGRRVMIGSAHFVLEDEGVPCTPEQRETISAEDEKYSVLYLAYENELAGIICIEDPIRGDALETVQRLRSLGVGNIIMLTGDNQRTADSTARKVGISSVRAHLLPEDKTSVINGLRDDGATVAMVGDGINDSPSLSAAHVGVSMKSAADIAREVADIVLTDNRLGGIIDTRMLSTGVMRKVRNNYAFIIATNSALLALGLSGKIPPTMSALLHNLSTIGATSYSLMPILGKRKRNR